jgi:hypothetical protein
MRTSAVEPPLGFDAGVRCLAAIISAAVRSVSAAARILR